MFSGPIHMCVCVVASIPVASLTDYTGSLFVGLLSLAAALWLIYGVLVSDIFPCSINFLTSFLFLVVLIHGAL